MKLFFVTGNSSKIKFAKERLDIHKIELIPQDLELHEIQSDNIEDVATSKAEQAFAILKKPLMVSDHGWFIPALNGFPGAYMKYVNGWFTPDDYLNLMKGKTDRRVILKQVICYKDDKECKLFVHEAVGKFLDVQKGTGVPSTTVISFDENGKSIAEINKETGKSAVDDTALWDEFAGWVSK